MNLVHNLNVVHLRAVPDDRRRRSRDQRRSQVLAAAHTVVIRDGLQGLTMQAVADELDCAVGTLYTYFTSKAELEAGLQARAVATLGASLRTGMQRWDAHLDADGLPGSLAALVRLVAFGSFWSAASVVLADECGLARQMLATRVPGTDRTGTDRTGAVGTGRTRSDLAEVLDDLVSRPAALLTDAVVAGVLTPGDDQARALVWLSSMNAVLDLDGLAAVDRHLFRVANLMRLLTRSLLVGWGADPEQCEVADAHVERLAAAGPMAPVPDPAP
jgi:AcrR family transcriptional regulator